MHKSIQELLDESLHFLLDIEEIIKILIYLLISQSFTK